MQPVVRVAVQCSDPLVRAVLVRHLAVAADVAVVGLVSLGAGDTLVQVVRTRTPRSAFALRSAVAMGLRVIVLVDGAADVDLADAVAPLAAVTGPLLLDLVRGRRLSPARYAELVEDGRSRDTRWIRRAAGR